jgi:hypothetical protein
MVRRRADANLESRAKRHTNTAHKIRTSLPTQEFLVDDGAWPIHLPFIDSM